MTAQVGEKLLYRGQITCMHSEPLEAYFESGGARPHFAFVQSSLWRGYLGTWKILRGRLYLADLNGTLLDGSEATLATLFPNRKAAVFAVWYSGELVIPEGNLLEYVHNGFRSRFSRERLIDVEKGIVIGERIIRND